MRFHGVPEEVIAADEPFWDFLRDDARRSAPGVRLADGDTIAAGGRTLRVVARPGHSTTDTLFVDGRDGARVHRRPPALADLLQHRDLPAPARPTGARARACATSTTSATARDAAAPLLTGHGAAVTGHQRLVARASTSTGAAASASSAILGAARAAPTRSPASCGPRDGGRAAAAGRLGGARPPRAAARRRRGGRGRERRPLGLRADPAAAAPRDRPAGARAGGRLRSRSPG